MGGRSDDDAEAPTLAQTPGLVTTGASRASRHEITGLGPGAMIGRYCLARRIGAGAMGVVWSAHDPQLDRSIAIKLVHPSLARSDEAAGRLLREARAMAKLSHRSVIVVHDAGGVDGQLFIAMELIDGTNLGTILRGRSEPEVLDWRTWLAIMLEAGKGLEAAHRGGVLHRDFKPDNVLVAESGRVAVGDFGLATLGEETFAAVLSQRADKPTYAVDLTTTGSLLGTPAYMSPQQLRSETVDARADQFSFCVATWEAIYGARPFTVDRDSLDAVPELAATIETGVLPAPPSGCTVPASVRAVLSRGLAADPTARWPDMTSLLAALETARAPEKAREATIARPPARSRRRYLVLAGGVAVLGVITAFAVGRRAATSPPADPVTVRAPLPAAAIKKLFSVPFRTGMTMSPDGKLMLLHSDRLQIREVDGSKQWSTVLPNSTDEASYAEFEDGDIRFAVRDNSNLYRWNYASDATPRVEIQSIGGAWYGRSILGDVIARNNYRELAIIDGGREVRTWKLPRSIDAPTPSPDRRRMAFIEATRFSGVLGVLDVDSGRTFRSESLISPTAVAWVDDQTLVYATGTLEQPRIMRVSIAGGRFGVATEMFGLDTGWFGPMSVRGDRLYVIQMQPSPRARLIDRSTSGVRSRDLDHASVSLGWTADHEYLSWSRNSHRVERRTEQKIELTKSVLDGEPANATNAGDVLIAAMRRPTGREVIAVSRSTGGQLWRHQDGRTLAVRCAGDLHAPCFAIRVTETDDEIVTLAPATGELGTQPIYRGKAEDLAVSADGTRLLVVGDGATVTEIDPTGKVLSTRDLPMSLIRSIAYDPHGDFLAGGTKARNNYVVGEWRNNTWDILMEADDDILSFVRPSPDGNQVLVLARVYAPEVWQIQLARP